MRRRLLAAILLAGLHLAPAARAAETAQRFPPPDFETGYRLPEFADKPWRAGAWQYVDAAALAAAMAAMTWLLLYRRSRTGVVVMTAASLAYFGFFRGGCVCPIGAIQNVSLGLADRSFAVPWSVVFFFAVPIVFALFFGRVFCGGVCPLGAIQDLVLIRPVRVPARLAAGLGVIPFSYLGLAVLLAATDSAFVICRYDPFVSFFRLAGPLHMLVAGAAFLVASAFIGRPYCRFVCPYGAVLSVCSRVAWKRVTTTPDECVVCGLCEEACPFDCIRAPNAEKGVEF